MHPAGDPPQIEAQVSPERPIRPVLEGVLTGLSVLAASLLAIAGLWRAAIDEYKHALNEDLVHVAEAAAATVDVELHATLRHPSQLDTSAYARAVAPLKAILGRVEDVTYIYTFVADGHDIRFVLDAATPGDHDGDGVEDRARLWERYDTPDPAMGRALGLGGRTPISVGSGRPYRDKWGVFVSGYAPLFDAEGRPAGAVGVDVRADEFIASMNVARRAAFFGLLPAIGASVCVGLMVWDQRRGVLAAHLRLRAQTKELDEARRAAEAASMVKGAFMANMTHELRTPLTAILGYAEVLERERSTDEEAAEWTRALRRSAEHLLGLINDVLDYSKIEAGKMRAESIECSPARIFDDVRLLMAERAASKGLALTVEWRGDAEARAVTDPTRVRQILLNLVGNAIKFTESGSVTLTGTLEPGAGGRRLVARVADTGIGMSEEQCSQLFRPFTQADASMSRRFGGTGLGLCISRELARLLGGDLTVASRPGRGTTFELTAMVGAPRPDAQAGPVVRAVECGEGALRGMRVLVVEDGVDNQRLVRHHLSRAGAEVTTAENGEVALRLLRDPARRFDIVLMDMQMPVMDGYEATRRARRAGFDLPIIAMTANAHLGESATCLGAGCDDFVAKPFSRATLIEVCLRWRAGRGASMTRSRAEARQD